MILIGAFASISLVLCCIGVYGVIAFGVTRQRREFGIRLALGASRRGIATLVLSRGLLRHRRRIGHGRLARAQHELDALRRERQRRGEFRAATAAVLIVAAVASHIPARRAAAVDPAITLRAE